MKSKYRNILIGTAIASVLGVTGAAFAHGGAYGGNWQQDTQAQPGCGGNGPSMGMNARGMGMMGGIMHMMDGHGMGTNGSGGMMDMMGGMQRGMGFGYGPDLSEEQKSEMAKIREEILPLMGELRGKMQANHEQMRSLRRSGDVDQAAITALADQKGDLIAEMIKLRSRHHDRMDALLTEDQREQMRQHRQGMGMWQG